LCRSNLLTYYTKVFTLAVLFITIMRIRLKVVIISAILLAVTFSCKRNHYKVNISGIDATVKIKRLEEDLFAGSPIELKGKVPLLKEKYDGFLQLFSYVINIGKVNETTWSDDLVRFSTDKLNNEVYDSTIRIFPDVNEIEKGLTDAFKHYLFYFPGKEIPGIYTCISGFNNSIIVGDSALGIGLDRYLGSACKYYPQLQFYKYQTAKMNPWNIIPDCMYAWASSEWDFKTMGYSQDNVLTGMIHEGKLLYFVKCMLPEMENNVIFGFKPDQMKFCSNNEDQMWQYLIENKLLFNTELLTIRKLTGESPFTSYFSKESPGRAAVWIGFRIVESYMMKSNLVTLEDLMKNTDIQGILEKAAYNPK
jgi:hypothetical protein